MGYVTLVQETLAYANSDELGSVFVPGSVFEDSGENALTAFLSVSLLVRGYGRKSLSL